MKWFNKTWHDEKGGIKGKNQQQLHTEEIECLMQ